MKRLTIASLSFMIILAILFGASTQTALAVMKWRFQNYDLPGGVSWQAVENFANSVKKMSKGAIEIEVFPSGAIIPNPEILTAVSKGVVDIAWFPGNIQAGMLPASPLIQAPLLYPSSDDVNILFFERGLSEVIQEMYKPLNVMVIGHQFEGQILTWCKEPIKTLADFKGKKYRFFGDYSKLLSQLGASIVSLPHTESYTALTLGTIDGYGTAVVKFRDMKHYEITKHLLGTPFCAVAPAELILNMDTYNKLTPDLQEMLKVAGREFAWETLRLNRIGENDIFAKAEKEWGVTISYLPQEDEKKLRQMASEIWKQTAKKAGPLGTKFYDIAVNYLKEKGDL